MKKSNPAAKPVGRRFFGSVPREWAASATHIVNGLTISKSYNIEMHRNVNILFQKSAIYTKTVVIFVRVLQNRRGSPAFGWQERPSSAAGTGKGSFLAE